MLVHYPLATSPHVLSERLRLSRVPARLVPYATWETNCPVLVYPMVVSTPASGVDHKKKAAAMKPPTRALPWIFTLLAAPPLGFELPAEPVTEGVEPSIPGLATLPVQVNLPRILDLSLRGLKVLSQVSWISPVDCKLKAPVTSFSLEMSTLHILVTV
jgi:hypothetical protein